MWKKSYWYKSNITSGSHDNIVVKYRKQLGGKSGCWTHKDLCKNILHHSLNIIFRITLTADHISCLEGPFHCAIFGLSETKVGNCEIIFGHQSKNGGLRSQRLFHRWLCLIQSWHIKTKTMAIKPKRNLCDFKTVWVVQIYKSGWWPASAFDILFFPPNPIYISTQSWHVSH